MKRNTIFGAAALLVAGAAIGAGSMVSSNAMAETGSPAATSQLKMVTFGTDGKPLECTFSGADAEGLLPAAPAGVPADATPVKGNVVVGQAQLIPADGNLPVPPAGLVPTGSGTITVTATATATATAIAGVPGDLPQLSSHDPVQIISGGDARAGTADECNALHDQAVEMAKNAATGASVVIDGGTIVTATKP